MQYLCIHYQYINILAFEVWNPVDHLFEITQNTT